MAIPRSLPINICLFLFGALTLTVPSGYIIAPAALVLIALPTLFKKGTYVLTLEQKLVVFTLVAYFIVQAICAFLDIGSRSRDFDLPSRALTAAIIVLLLVHRKVKFEWLAMGFATGAILSGCIAGYQKFILGFGRAFSGRMPIQSGDISMTLGLICLCFTLYYYRLQKRQYVLLFSAASFMGMVGSLLSGSRGGWILLPIILFIFYQMHKAYLTKAARRIAVGGVIALVALCFIPQTGIPSRVIEAKNDLTLYFSGEWRGQDHSNSLGIRLLLWQSAIDSFVDRPVLGWGKNGLRQSQELQLSQGKITQSMFDFNSHAHNQYLDEMAKRGIIGLIALMLIFLLPLSLFKRQFNRREDAQCQAVAAAGIMTVLSTMDYCLSQAFFNHNSGATFYFTAIAILLGFLLRQNKAV